MRALVLSGGGARGAYEAGLVCTLIEEFGERFDIICGTSIGAINAAFLAQDDTAALANLWRTIAEAKIISLQPRISALQTIFLRCVEVHQRRGLAKTYATFRAFFTIMNTLKVLNPLSTFPTVTGAIDPQNTKNLLNGRLKLALLKHTLITTTTDLLSSTPEVFYFFPATCVRSREVFLKNEPDALAYDAAIFAEMIRASCVIPGAFSPIELPRANEQACYVDGGIVNNTPIGQAIDAGGREITVIYLDPFAQKGTVARVPTTIPGILLSCFGIMQQRILALDYQIALRVNDAVGAGANDTQSKEIIKLRTFRPETALPARILDFDKQDLIDATYAQGQADARTLSLRNAWEQ